MISVDSTSQSAVVTSGSSLAWNHTVGGGTGRALIVGVGTRNDTPANAVVTNVTYGGQALTKVRSDDGAASAYKRTELWALFNPPSGTAQIAVTLAGGTSHFIVGAAISLFGADSIEASSGAGNQSGNPASHSITSLSDGALLIDACCHLGNTLAPGGATDADRQIRECRRVVRRLRHVVRAKGDGRESGLHVDIRCGCRLDSHSRIGQGRTKRRR